MIQKGKRTNADLEHLDVPKDAADSVKFNENPDSETERENGLIKKRTKTAAEMENATASGLQRKQ